MKTPHWLGVIALVVLAFIAGKYLAIPQSQPQAVTPEVTTTTVSDPTTTVIPDSKIETKTVTVAKFYDGNDGYSIAIPSGNSSTCVWTWVGGNASIPYSETTQANSATEKHTVRFPGGVDSLWDFKANCTDDFGNQYTGVFPS